MEYILEELLRQRRALAALMTGEMPEEQESGGTGTGNGPDTALPGNGPGWLLRQENFPGLLKFPQVPG